MPNNSSHAIGIDIGGTKMAVAVVDAAGRILARTSLPTEAKLGFDRAVDRLTLAIEHVHRLAGEPRPGPAGAGIGIGCAGPVDPGRGLINNPFTLEGWDRCDIVTPLRERFGGPVLLENDADAAALGECWIGAGQDCDPVVLLTFGTGVGGGSIIHGQILRGAREEHPELGHIACDPSGPACYCGFTGCLESLASGTAIAQAGSVLGLADAREVFQAARTGNAEAHRIIERATTAAATAAWSIYHALLPGRLILGGGIMETEFDRFAETIRRRLSHATQFSRHLVDIVPARLGNDAGLVGAARLAFQARGGAPRTT